jgi:hypothetical protein
MAAIEARSLQKTFKGGQNPDIPTIIDLLRKSSWALDQPFKTIETNAKRAVLGINRCRTQEARLSKDLQEFPCKKVRYSYLENFARTLNPSVQVSCLTCPPDRHPRESWCKWEFTVPV